MNDYQSLYPKEMTDVTFEDMQRVMGKYEQRTTYSLLDKFCDILGGKCQSLQPELYDLRLEIMRRIHTGE